jgi:RNA polymerase sigma-70 factor (ECF subfamily)
MDMSTEILLVLLLSVRAIPGQTVDALYRGTTRYAEEPAADERNLRLEAIFREHAPRILDYARHRGSTLAEAEDVVSEVFIVLTRRLDDAPAEVLPWLYGVTRKVLANQLRGQRRRLALRRRTEEEAARGSRVGRPGPFIAAQESPVVQGICRLSDEDREALLLVAWDGLSYEEAARSLGCSREAFAKRFPSRRPQV